MGMLEREREARKRERELPKKEEQKRWPTTVVIVPMYFLTSRYKAVTLNPSAIYQSSAYFIRNRHRRRGTLHLRNIDVRKGILKGCINRGHNSCPWVHSFSNKTTWRHLAAKDSKLSIDL